MIPGEARSSHLLFLQGRRRQQAAGPTLLGEQGREPNRPAGAWMPRRGAAAFDDRHSTQPSVLRHYCLAAKAAGRMDAGSGH